MSLANTLKGKIAMGRKQIPTYDDDKFWRDNLEKLTGLRSLSGCEDTKLLGSVVDFLASKGAVFASAKGAQGKPYKAKACQRRSEWYEIPDGPLAEQKRRICALWKGLGYDLTKIDTRVQKQNGTETLRWCKDAAFLRTFLQDLTNRMKRKKAKDAAKNTSGAA